MNLYFHKIKLDVFNFLVHGSFDMPGSIGIETSTACNRRCVYCPQSVSPKKQKFIDKDIWNIFIDRILEYKWKGATSIIKYNEPGLIKNSDSYIFQLHSIGCRPIIFTNGDFPDMVLRWCKAGAFRIRITEHPPFKEGWHEKLIPIQEEYPSVVKIAKLSFIHNQAGEVQGEKFERCFNAHGLSINIDGSVSMCCVDYHSTHIVGNITKQSFSEIWNDKDFRGIRNKVIKGIPATEMCKSCLK